MTNKEIFQLYTALNELINNSTDRKFPIAVSFKIMRNVSLLKPIYEDIEKTRGDIIQKYCSPQPENPGMYSVREDAQEDFNREINELSDIEVPIELIKVKLEDFGDIELSLADMQTLMPMIGEE